MSSVIDIVEHVGVHTQNKMYGHNVNNIKSMELDVKMLVAARYSKPDEQFSSVLF